MISVYWSWLPADKGDLEMRLVCIAAMQRLFASIRVATWMLAALLLPLKAQVPQAQSQALANQVIPIVRQVLGTIQSLGTIDLGSSKGHSNTYTYQAGRYDEYPLLETACTFTFSITHETVVKEKGQQESGVEVRHSVAVDFTLPVRIYVGDVASRGPEVWMASQRDTSKDRPGQLYNPAESGCDTSGMSGCGVRDASYKDGSKTGAQDFVVLEHLPSQQFAASLQNLLQRANDLCAATRAR